MQTQDREINSNGNLMRADLDQSLKRSHIEPSSLSTFQRVLLTTDGTVTEMLEAYLLENMKIVKLAEGLVSSHNDIPALKLQKGTSIIERKILLQGKISHKNFLYAESVIVPERLEERFQDDLLKSKTPIGKLWLQYKVETFKEIIDSGKEPTGQLADYFLVEKDDKILFRTYIVFTNRQPVMMITEKFPETYFRI
ncbi:chorismate--pyruvate lyase family protein [Spirulina sp. 06S082]|uniref:chorismate--pyruvate lyase family protein n=1 Tax=Spirulina sp. 06S082 TaxID=3110248 RepID=UPI002B21A0A0|nr:chorismate pyruvate-lyase family protein [Spirulina sp. 06S082]MEA5469868.1 chorismate pyruvate-lyase family protein [Spirulina sp. 06S082]